MIKRLNTMLQTLSNYHRDKDELMKEYISQRLEKSFNQYDKELKQSFEYLTHKHEKSLIKRMKTK